MRGSTVLVMPLTHPRRFYGQLKYAAKVGWIDQEEADVLAMRYELGEVSRACEELKECQRFYDHMPPSPDYVPDWALYA